MANNARRLRRGPEESRGAEAKDGRARRRLRPPRAREGPSSGRGPIHEARGAKSCVPKFAILEKSWEKLQVNQNVDELARGLKPNQRGRWQRQERPRGHEGGSEESKDDGGGDATPVLDFNVAVPGDGERKVMRVRD